MPRTARVNTNYNYMGPHPPPFTYNGMSPNMSPLWTYQTTGKFILPDLPTKCDSCGGVLPGGRRLNNLFTRRCRCNGDAASYTPVEDDGVCYKWDPNSVQVVELFRPNPLPELPDSFKRLRAADDAHKAHQPRSRSTSRSQRRRNTPVGPAFEEPAITFKVQEARRRLQRVRDSTTATEPLHPFIDVLLDTLNDVASDQPRPRARRSTVVASRPARRVVANDRTQAAVAPVRDAHGLPSPPPSPPQPPAQTSMSQVPSPRVPLPRMTRDPVAEPLYVPEDLSATSSPEVTYVFTAERHPHPAAHSSTRPPLRSILRNAHGNPGRSEPRQLPSPDATPRQRHSPLNNPASSVEPNANPAGATATSGTPHSAHRMGQLDSRAQPQAAAIQMPAGQTSVAPTEAGPFSPPGAFVIQTQTPLVHPRPSRPTSSTHFSPLLRAHGSPPRSPVRINAGIGPAPPVYLRYEPTDGPFSVLAPEAVTTSQFSVFGESFWSVSQALAWAKAHRFMHSSEGEREDRIVARARQQEILNLSPFADGFVQDAFRLYEETPITPSWVEYETVCADIVTKAKITGPDSRARDVLLNQTGERDIYWDVNSTTWGRGREKPEGRNAYGRMLMMMREFIRLRPGSPLIDLTNPLSDLLYGLRG